MSFSDSDVMLTAVTIPDGNAGQLVRLFRADTNNWSIQWYSKTSKGEYIFMGSGACC